MRKQIANLTEILARNWEFAASVVAAAILILLTVADRFGQVDLDSSWVGTALVALVTLLAAQMARLREGVSSLVRQRESNYRVEEIPPAQIAGTLRDLLVDTRSWKFRGGSAKWQLAGCLPVLANRRDFSIRYLMQVVDPFDESLVEKYAEYRWESRSASSRSPHEQRGKDLQENILAALYGVGYFAAISRVEPEVVFLRSFSPIRYDVADEGLVATVADKSAPGLWAPKRSWYYRSVVDELEQLARFAPKVSFPASGNFPEQLSGVDEAAVISFLSGVTVSDSGQCRPLIPQGVQFEAARVVARLKGSV